MVRPNRKEVSMTHSVRYEVDEYVAVLTLDRPETRNALSDDLLDELLVALERARDDGDVRVAVLASSHERIFSAGGDLKASASDAPTARTYSGLDRFPGQYRLIGGRGQPGRRAAGGDLKAFASDAPTIMKYSGLDRFPRLYRLIGGLGKPVICAAGGDVLAGAFGLALACDFVLAKESAQFGCPEINVGVFPFMISALI